MKIIHIEKSLYASGKKKKMNVRVAFSPEGEKAINCAALCVSDSVALLERSAEECL